MSKDNKIFAFLGAMLCIAVFWIIIAGYRSVTRDQEQWYAERKALLEKIHKCIDLGGYPVTLETYVKGAGEGHVCIKSVEVIVV
jgi:hypothetical protein